MENNQYIVPRHNQGRKWLSRTRQMLHINTTTPQNNQHTGKEITPACRFRASFILTRTDAGNDHYDVLRQWFSNILPLSPTGKRKYSQPPPPVSFYQNTSHGMFDVLFSLFCVFLHTI
jgi:hypothetical protein